ncbi:MAG: YraN family protein [Alphaproteobacteria bacterium]|nr:YraN family protein [Alphaproteobacteria bacterium]
MTNYARGIWAERYAALYLFFKGFRILATRFKTPVGEIDLIAVRNNVMVFVEVKSRTSLDSARAAIAERSQYRISRAAQYFLSKNHCPAAYKNYTLRFDVIALSKWKLAHIPNAWMIAS